MPCKYGSLAKKAPWTVHIALCSDKGGGRILVCNIAAFYHEKVPMLTLSQPTCTPTHPHPVLLAAVKLWIAGGDASFEFTSVIKFWGPP